MFRMILLAACCFGLLQACNPPVRLKPSNVKTGLDSTFYAGVVGNPKLVDLREAQFLAHIKVGDLGVTLECEYPDVLENANREVRRIGGNLLVITEHTRNKSKSRCHCIKGDIYKIASLEGLEAQIRWHPERPLLAGDLRGKVPANFLPSHLPPIQTDISSRIGGDYFKEAILRTETIFLTDSTFVSGDAGQQALLLRRAQLCFNLAELHARRLKSNLLELGPDVSAITGKFREMRTRQQESLRQELQALDKSLATLSPAALSQEEGRVQAELLRLQQLAGDQVVDLRKKKK